MASVAGKLRMKLGPRKRFLLQCLSNCKDLIEKCTFNEDIMCEAKVWLTKINRNLESYRELVSELENSIDMYTEETEKENFEKEMENLYELLIQCEMTEVELSSKIEIWQSKFAKQPIALTTNTEQASTSTKNTEGQSMSTMKSEQQSMSSLTTSHIRLPKLEMEKFNGDIFQWHSFWDVFENAIHENSNLSNVEKMNYLKGQLGGEALNAIADFSLTKSNYLTCIDILKQRFAKKDIIIHAHYSQLREISIPAESSSMRQAFDKIERHLRGLENLEQDTESPVLVSMILSKLPTKLVEKLAETNHGMAWSMTMIRQNWRKHLESMEFAKSVSSNASFDRSEHEVETVAGLIGGVRSCFYCQDSHFSDMCPTFDTVEARKNKIKGNCFSCLRKGHKLEDCRKKRKCVHCTKFGSHHRSLCYKKFCPTYDKSPKDKQPKSFTPRKKFEEKQQEKSEQSLLSNDSINYHSIIQTAKALIMNKENGAEVRETLVFDTGSQRSYITTDLAQKLNLKTYGTDHLLIHTFGVQGARRITATYSMIEVKQENGVSLQMRVTIIPKITGTVTKVAIPKDINIPRKFQLADSIPNNESFTVEILIGNDYYWELFPSKIQRESIAPGLYVVKTNLGWILSGRVKSSVTEIAELSMLTHQDSHIWSSDLTKLDVDKYWNLETIGIKESRQNQVHEEFLDKVKFENKRYSISWPFKENIRDLPSNYGLAAGRLGSLVRRLKDDPELLNRYNKVFTDQLEKHVIERVEDTSTPYPVHYIPHHHVITPGKSTKLRIVFDASAKNKQTVSLNECIYQGPLLLENLCGLLLQFRQHKIGIIADLEKAFLQVGLQDDSKDITRFLWLKDINKPDITENVEIFRFSRVPFGIISSPYMLAATINHHLDKTDTVLSKKVKSSIYVDNLITGVNNSDEGIQLYKETKTIFKKASMNMTQWISSDTAINSAIEEQDKEKYPEVKVLGYWWSTINDTISVKMSNNEKEVNTKRQALSLISQCYDPLGLFTPVMVSGKVELQNIWKNESEWDEQFSPEQKTIWMKIKKELNEISNYSLPRYTGTTQQIHCFTDASEKAYAAVIFAVTTDQSHIIFAKSRVAPLRAAINTIPRLELMGVLIGMRCLKFVQEYVRAPETYLWSDSQCVLSWVQGQKQLPIFIQNRVDEIVKIQRETKCIFKYVNTEDNPADVASRGAKVTELCDLWWHGPSWLCQSTENWPTWDLPQEENVEKPVRLHEFSGIAPTEVQLEFPVNIERHSSLKKLTRTVCYVLKFVKKLRKKNPPSEITTEDYAEATLKLEKAVQKEEYNNELTEILNGKRNILASQLDLFIDENGLLRCRGRLRNAELAKTAVHPILLPKKHHYTKLVIESQHRRCLHSGVSHTLAYIRNQYWIPHGRTVVRKIIQNCVTCRRYEGGPYKYPTMPPFPKERVTSAKPFTAIGLDYLGPILIKGINEPLKVWVCIFTCMAIRGVHMEVVNNLTAVQFSMGVRRFMARRGRPKLIVSDNAPQFKVVKTAMALTHPEINWNFITPNAPWMGGFYERMVGLVKRNLKKVVGNIRLTHTQLVTILTEVEEVVNQRPLTYVGNEFPTGNILRPADFMCLNPSTGDQQIDPERELQNIPAQEVLQMWKKGNRHLESFWNTWKADYLTSLRERYNKTIKSSRILSKSTPTVGDIVLVKENMLPRGSWRMARISELIRSEDGCIRSGKIQVESGRILIRPISLLYPLEMNEPTEKKSDDPSEEKSDDASERKSDDPTERKSDDPTERKSDDPEGKSDDSTRRKRKAAVAARDKIKKWTA